MVLVPSFLEIHGLVLPLRVDPPAANLPAHVLLSDDCGEDGFAGLMYVTGALVMRPAELMMSLIEHRQDLPMPQELFANFVSPDLFEESEVARHSQIWQQLTGGALDLGDAYLVGGSFVDSLVIPGATFLALMRKLYELNAAISEGRMEPRIDDTIPLPRPR